MARTSGAVVRDPEIGWHCCLRAYVEPIHDPCYNSLASSHFINRKQRSNFGSIQLSMSVRPAGI